MQQYGESESSVASTSKTVTEDVASRDDDITRDEIFDVLSNARRRCIVHYLKKHGDRRVELCEIVDYVAAWEADTSIDKLDSDRRKSVYSAVRQTHLPKLEDAGLIDYDHMRGGVELTDELQEVQLYLEYVPGNDTPWSEYYLGLSVVSATLVAVSWLGLYPFGAIPGFVLAFALAGVFGVSALIQMQEAWDHQIGTSKYELND